MAGPGSDPRKYPQSHPGRRAERTEGTGGVEAGAPTDGSPRRCSMNLITAGSRSPPSPPTTFPAWLYTYRFQTRGVSCFGKVSSR